MKKIRLQSILIAILFAILLSACTDPIVQSSSTSLSGDIVGFVFKYDLNGLRQADNSGIVVSCKNNYADTSIVVLSTNSDTTSIDGRFMLPNVSSGSYNITIAKNGFGTKKVIGYQFVGGGQAFLGIYGVYSIPAFSITGFTATYSSTAGYITLGGTFTGVLPTSTKYLRYFVSTSPNVSSLPTNYIFTSSSGTSSTGTTFSTLLSQSTLALYGITSGQTIYIVAYAESYSSSSYIDVSTGRYFYTSLNSVKSNIVSVVVP